MKVFFVRHWETYHNAAGIIQGHFDGKLNDTWKDQAKRIAKKLSTEKIDIILSSTLSRAADTAKEISSYHNNVEYKESSELIERTFGEYDDVSKEELIKENGWDLGMSLFEFAIRGKGAETDQECYDRAMKVLFMVAHLQVDSVCIVSHWWFARFIHGVFLWMSLKEIQDEFVIIGNASVTVYEGHWNEWELISFNDRSHLS